MSFSRTPSGLAAEYLFYPEILVYVEGHTDILFYDTILQNYNCRIRTYREEKGSDKLTEELIEKNRPYVVIIDGHYEMLERTRSQHRRVVFLHRHSYENYLFEKEPIKEFCRDRIHSQDSLETPLTSDEFTTFVEDIEVKFKYLLILDVAHRRSKTGQRSFFRGPDQFFQEDFRDNEIQKQQETAAKNVSVEAFDEAKILVEEYLKEHRCLDLIPGHFAFGIMRRLASNTVGTSISKDEIRLYLSKEVWRLANTRDHRSLKRRLRKAVREVEQMRESNSNQTQSNTGS